MDPNSRRYKPPVDDDSDSELSDVPDDAILNPHGRHQYNQVHDDDEDAEGEEEEDAEGEDDEDAEGEEDDEIEEEEEEESESEEDEGEDAYEYSEGKESASSSHSTPKPPVGRGGRGAIGVKPAMPAQRGRAVIKTQPKRGRPAGGRKPAAPSSVSSAASAAQPTIRLTLKMPKDRLRQATSGWNSGHTSSGESSRVTKTKAPPRSSRSTRKIIEPSTSEEEEEEEEDAEGEEDDDIEMSDADATGIPDDDTMMMQDDEDDQELEEEEEEDEEDAMGETDDDEVMPSGSGMGTGTSTPDLSKMTKRQRSRLNEVYSADLMELPATGFGPSPANKLHLTADEQALRRAEMARRRRNLTVQKLEEEKMETINRLLNRQPPKTRGRGVKTGDATPQVQGEDGEEEEASASAVDNKVKDNLPKEGYVRWVSKKEGESLFVPDSWLEAPVGKLFGGPRIVMMEVEEKENVVA